MLRPATPLAVLLLVAFALLLISVLSTPIVKGIKLGSFQGVDFGVFGYCKGSRCSGATVGYDPAGQFNSHQNAQFSLPPGARRSLSSLLIVHPIAALFTLVLLVLSVTAHLHSPSHSPRYLLILILLMLPTFLLCLLAFLVDILLFVPHMQWGGWLVLAATIILAAGGVVICAMRRTLVSRKAHHKRIAENAEMNGTNYYDQTSMSPPAPLSAQPTTSTAVGGPDKLPEFATFDVGQKNDGRVSQEERIPLNPRTPSNATGSGVGMNDRVPTAVPMAGADDGSLMFRGPQRVATDSSFASGRIYPDNNEHLVKPQPPPGAIGATSALSRDYSDPRLREQGPNGSFTPPISGPPPGYGGRGRGGYAYGPDGRGGYGRGGYPPPSRTPSSQGMDGEGRATGPGSVGPVAGMALGRGGPVGAPSGYNRGYGSGPYGQSGPYAREQSPSGGYYGRRPSPGPPPSGPNFRRRASPGPQQFGGYGSREPSPGPLSAGPLGRNASPAPPMPAFPNGEGLVVGQAVEMDASTGSPSPSRTGFAQGPPRPGTGELPGVPRLPSGRQGSPMRHDPSGLSPTSVYSGPDSYIPARAGWGPGNQRPMPPIDLSRMPPKTGPNTSPVELPTARSAEGDVQQPVSHARVGSGDTYYEDVDPRFVEPEPTQPAAELSTYLHPTYHQPGAAPYPGPDHSQAVIPGSNSYEDIHEMARSPAQSDASNYTSVSQRGINPNWMPPPPDGGSVALPRPVHQRQQRDMLLAGNADFALPTGRGRGLPAGNMPGSMGPPGGGGRYPT